MTETDDANRILSRVIEGWCDSCLYKPLSILLPPYVENNGLMDGWTILLEAVDETLSFCEKDLLAEEVQDLRNARRIISSALNAR